NYIVLVNGTAQLNTAAHLFLYPFTTAATTLLKGASVSFTALATDGNYHPITAPAISWRTAKPSVGTINANGLFTAQSAGECQVEAVGGGASGGASGGTSGGASGGTSGNVTVRVTDKVDSLQFVGTSGGAITSLSASPGKRVQLSIRSLFEGMSVVNQNKCFTWKVEGSIGSVSPDGVFTATERNGVAGVITAEYNGKKASLSVMVGSRPTPVETFEADNSRFGPSTASIGFSFLSDSEKAQYGLRSGQITYQFGSSSSGSSSTGSSSSGNAVLSLPANVPLPSGSTYLSLWVSGDGSGNRLSLDVTTAGGSSSTLAVGTLSFTGYRQFHVNLPNGAAKVSAVKLTRASGGAAKGSFRTDQWVASPVRYDNKTPPTVGFDAVTLSSDGKVLSVRARALDASGLPLAAENVTLKLDGKSVKIAYSTVTGQLTYTLTNLSNSPHRLTLEAVDPSGARSRASYDIAGTGDGTVNPFRDVSNSYWASTHIHFLYRQGVLEMPSDGSRKFYPGKALTRADIAVYVARMLQLDLSQYSGVTLPFTDTSRIPKAAVGSVRALYALGMIKGKTSGGGLIFDPGGTMSRSDFFTLLGRTMPRGYASAALGFADTATIPSYAKGHVQTMVALGYVAGLPDNTLRPGNKITRAEAAKLLYMFF
ncbi:MAG: S-layer homology domain-containing protein, partial [Oscillospiraceae bacterium]|nr:S-layer homology domain-containing protein [Oscillospiraceae bacterium]